MYVLKKKFRMDFKTVKIALLHNAKISPSTCVSKIMEQCGVEILGRRQSAGILTSATYVSRAPHNDPLFFSAYVI